MHRAIAAAALLVMGLTLAACGGDTGSFSREAFYDVKAGDTEQEVRAAVGRPDAIVDRSDDPGLETDEEGWVWVEGGTLYKIHFSAAGEVRFTDYGPCLARLHTESLCGEV